MPKNAAKVRSPAGQRAVVFSLAVAGLVFAVDSVTPLGVASAVPYTLAVLVALKAQWRRFVYWFALLCSILTMLDLAIGPGPGGTEMWKVVTNRLIALFMIWVTAILGIRRREAEDRRRCAEEQTQLHLADLAHLGRLETAGQLAAELAHELSQPLAAMSLQSEIAVKLALEEGQLKRQELFCALREITDQSQRAAAILRSLRRLVRKDSPLPVRVDLNQVIHDVIPLIDILARRAGVSIELHLADDVQVSADKTQLEQVLLNLLQNAIESVVAAGNGGGMVRIGTRRNERCVICSVDDTGVGLPLQEPGRIFERFYSTKPEGMGIGLTISRSIIEGHGGRLWAEPVAAGGATFAFSLPVAPGE